jgi:hypothetical protein
MRMIACNPLRTYLLVGVLVALPSFHEDASRTADPSTLSASPVAPQRDGQHDFDFEFGTWKVHNSRLLNPLTGSTTWSHFEGTAVARPVWNGRADLVELESDPPTGHNEGLILRLYNPQSHQWSVTFANSKDGKLSPPAIGGFTNGRGIFFDQEQLNGRSILARSVLSDITPVSYRLEQAFSDDGGRTWQVNWISLHTRVADASRAGLQPAPPERDGQHDFDFEIGSWHTHLKRLLHPLAGSTTWVEYDGTTVVREVWNGRANLVELAAAGPAGSFEGLSLRLYDPQSRQWSLNFANRSSGTLNEPTIGEFKDGRGEFFDQEPFNGRAILVRLVISPVTPDSCRFEQSFSDDGGKTWEVNWIAIDTKVRGDSAAAH